MAFEDNIKNGTPFSTPSGKIEIFSKTLYDLNRHKEIPGRAGYIECTEGPKDPLRKKYPLQLIAYHTKKEGATLSMRSTPCSESWILRPSG